MAFEFVRSENSAAPIEKEIPAANGTTYEHGCLLNLVNGAATTTTGKPEFVYAGKDITAKTGDQLAVRVVFPEDEYMTLLSASGSSLKAGNKVTTTGTKATATTGGGVFQLLTDGGASGSKVIGRFI